MILRLSDAEKIEHIEHCSTYHLTSEPPGEASWHEECSHPRQLRRSVLYYYRFITPCLLRACQGRIAVGAVTTDQQASDRELSAAIPLASGGRVHELSICQPAQVDVLARCC